MQRYRGRGGPRSNWWPGAERSVPLTLPPTLRLYAGVLAVTAATFICFELLPPLLPGHPSRVPLGIVARGVFDGALVGISAVGLILVYRASRIINFAHVALGSSAGIVVFQFGTTYNLPFVALVPLGLAVAVAAGALAELLLRRFTRAPRLVVTIATIALAPFLTRAMGEIIVRLNPLPPGETTAAPVLVRTLPGPFPEFHLRLPDSPLIFNFADVAGVTGALLLLAVVMLFLGRTRLGRAVRASAENPDAASLLGINVRVANTLTWALAAVLSAFGSLINLASVGIDTRGLDGGAVDLLPALVAAMIAGMELMPLAMLAGIWIAVVNNGLRWVLPGHNVFEVGLLAVMVLALILQRGRLQRRESTAGGAWDAARDIRPTPRELIRVPMVRNARLGLGGVGLLVLLAVPWITSVGQTHAVGTVLIQVMIVLSLLILTGWTGQVSLGQYAIVAIGAVVAGGLSQRFLLPAWIVLPVATLVGAIVAVALAVPSLRLRGLYLAGVTLALAVAIPVTLFNPAYFGWLLPNGPIARPSAGFINFEDETAFYYILLTATLTVLVLTWRFRRKRAGRILVALRDNEAAAQTAGIRAITSRVTAFAMSGSVAALAGGLLAFQQQLVDLHAFPPSGSINVFLFLVIGGMGSVSGAVLGAALGATVVYLVPGFSDLVVGTGAFMIMLVRPDGLAGLVYAGRDAVLRVVALRMHITAPGLFSDYDTEAQRRRVLPIAAAVTGRRVLTQPAARRYAQPSWIHGRGSRP